MIKLGILLSLISSVTFAWGPTGHRAIGEIAQRHLKRHAAVKLKKLLDRARLDEMSTWADEVTYLPEYESLKPLHYINILPDKNYSDTTPAKDGDVVVALKALYLFLKTENRSSLESVPALSKIDKPTAVKLLVHWVGDLHQPLHVIDFQDKSGKSVQGGNRLKVNWMNKWTTNLHAVWDFEMIDVDRLSYEEIASFAERGRDPKDETISVDSFAKWADETLGYREQVTKFADKQSYGESAEPGISDPIFISMNYVNANRQTIRTQIYHAGIRLARILNSLF